MPTVFRKWNLTKICFLVILISLLVSDYNFRWKDQQWKYAISSDGYDYYRYLPLVFIEKPLDDFQHKQFESSMPVIKHYAGTAILFLPFFLIAYFFTALFGLPPDGYSFFFQVFISLGNLFYLLAGLHYLNRFLKYYIRSEWIICLVLFSSFFATNVFYYSVIAPAWSHVLSFSMISFLLYQVKKIFDRYNRRSLFSIVVILSLIFWTRPTDIIIVVALPFLAGNSEVLKDTMKKMFADKKMIFFSFLIALIPAICQLYLYKLQTGHFIIWSYSKEGFDFLHPEFTNVLFSYAKGLFVYTPICLISLFGLLFLYKRNRFLFLGISIYLFFNAYIISSWWCWNYGYCYGQRAFIDHYAVFFFLLALLLDGILNKWMRVIILVLIIISNILNWIQTYQFEKGILDNDYKTDKNGYWSVFLRTDGGYSGKHYRHPVDTSTTNIVRNLRYFNDMEKADSLWICNNTLTEAKSHSGKRSSITDQKNNFSVGIKKNMQEIPYSKNVLIRLSGWFYVEKRNSKASLIVAFDNKKGRVLSYISFGLDKFMEETGRWEFQSVEVFMPRLSEDKRIETDKDNQVAIYLYNNSEISCYVDDLSIEFIEYKNVKRILDISWNN